MQRVSGCYSSVVVRLNDKASPLAAGGDLQIRTAPSSSASPLSLADLGERPAVHADETVIGSYESVLQAELVRGRLEAAGIAARLQDAHTGGLGGHLTAVIGGVKVVIAKDDVAAGQHILDTAAVVLAEDEPSGPVPASAKSKMQLRNKADDAARWAVLLAFLSFLIPVMGQLGCAVLIWRALDIGVALTPAGRRNIVVAGIIAVIAACAWAFALV